MADISIEFHATEQELAEWLVQWCSVGDITLVAMTFEPFSVKEVKLSEILAVLRDHDVRRLCLFASEPTLDVHSKVEFERANDDELVLDVGRVSEEGLGESWLACRSDNTDALAKWRHIAKDLKAKTRAGVTAINRQNGVSAFYKSHRFSQGAKELEDAGTPMLPIQGPNGPVIRLGNVDEAPEACDAPAGTGQRRVIGYDTTPKE